MESQGNFSNGPSCSAWRYGKHGSMSNGLDGDDLLRIWMKEDGRTTW
uniref:Uncharacterized protein n=2 Tax=Setaria TaxID=4554 RepID=K4A3H9_SETIT|nr:hypothetical protein SEVIR_2G009280v2 [Setaria viridis]